MTIPGLFDVILHCPEHKDQMKPCAICLVRRTDPETSLTAAKRVRGSIAKIRVNVLAVFDKWGPLTDKQLIAHYRQVHGETVPESSIRTRRNELKQAGRVIPCGETDHQTIWRLR